MVDFSGCRVPLSMLVVLIILSQPKQYEGAWAAGDGALNGNYPQAVLLTFVTRSSYNYVDGWILSEVQSWMHLFDSLQPASPSNDDA